MKALPARAPPASAAAAGAASGRAGRAGPARPRPGTGLVRTRNASKSMAAVAPLPSPSGHERQSGSLRHFRVKFRPGGDRLAGLGRRRGQEAAVGVTVAQWPAAPGGGSMCQTS